MAFGPGDVRWKLYAEAFRMWVPIVVSLCAISLTIYNAAQSRLHTRLSVQPRVDWRLTQDDGTGVIALTMVNVGFGPAIVTAIELDHGETEIGQIDLDACDRLNAMLGRDGDDWDTACFAMSGEYVLRPGDETLLYGNRPAPGEPQVDRDDPLIDFESVNVDIRYCSFYEECWWNERPQTAP